MNKRFLWVVGALIVIVVGAVFIASYLFSAKVPDCDEAQGRLIFVDRDDTADSIRTKSGLGFRWDIYNKLMSFSPRTGRYHAMPGTTCFELYRIPIYFIIIIQINIIKNL